MRYSLRALLVLVTIIAAFLAGRASNSPRIRVLEEQTSIQTKQIAKLSEEKNYWKRVTVEDLQAAGTGIQGVRSQPRTEAERGVYFLWPVKD